MKEYTISDTVYLLPGKGELILAQAEQISKFIKSNVDIDKVFDEEGGVSIVKLAVELGSSLSRLLAILLTPKGVKFKDKNIDKLEEEFRYNLSVDVAIEVISDFFTIQGWGSVIPDQNNQE